MRISLITYRSFLAILLGLLFLSSCTSTGPKGRPFAKWIKDKKKKKEPLNAPANMLYIPGGEFIMGDLDKGTSAPKNTLPHKKEVESFYMDRTEVTNLAYVAYLNWLNKNADELDYEFALPDTNCWYSPTSYNEPMVRNYLRHPAYRYYPVVGVNWSQAAKYCEWRSDRINELDSTSEEEIEIRLPTEEEWEYAALTNYNYNELTETNDRYFHIRQAYGFGRGKMMHNFQRGRGDLQGLGHRPNDAAAIPAPVYVYEPNEYGLYNMYGNVSEWVSDVYFPVTIEDVEQDAIDTSANELADSIKNDATYVDPNATFNNLLDSFDIKDVVRETEVTTDINNEVLRVYKGASFLDRAYYLNPAARRYMPQNIGTNQIGFRCAASVPEEMKAEKREDEELEMVGQGEESEEIDSTKKEKKGLFGRRKNKAVDDETAVNNADVKDKKKEKKSDKNTSDKEGAEQPKEEKKKKEKAPKKKKEKAKKEKKPKVKKEKPPKEPKAKKEKKEKPPKEKKPKKEKAVKNEEEEG